jgi:UDP-glucuronate decarboxylase
MRLLVSGGSGFLGSNLIGNLLDSGHHVICVDNGITGDVRNIEPFFANKNFSYLVHDVKIPISIDVDGIFNLACPASPPKYQDDPVDTFMTSILGAKNLLDLAQKQSCVILQASTSEIYGDPEISPQPEEYWGHVNPFGIRSCYDEGKRGAETLFHDYNRSYGTDTRIARIFNTYGPNMTVDDGRVVSNFIVQAITNTSLTVYGDGLQVRSLCYVSDLVEGLIRLFFADKLHSPVNLGNPEPISMVDLAREIISLSDSKSNLIFGDLPQDDPRIRIPQISKAKNLLGWEPTTNRESGLKQTIAYFTQQLKNKGTL